MSTRFTWAPYIAISLQYSKINKGTHVINEEEKDNLLADYLKPRSSVYHHTDFQIYLVMQKGEK